MAFIMVFSVISTVVIMSANSLSGKSGKASVPSVSKTLAKNLFKPLLKAYTCFHFLLNSISAILNII